MHKLAALTTIGLLLLLSACGGSSNNGNGGTQPTPVKLNMSTASSLVGQTAQFSANVPVTWAVKEANGGTITTNGLYTAPRDVGTFHVVATSKTDTSQTASAAVDVSAKFLSLQKNLTGTTTPYSVSPVLNTLKSDGKTFTSTILNDPSTSAPFDTNAYDVMISPDGTKAVATVLTWGPFQGEYTWFFDLVVASADGSQLTQITHNADIVRENDISYFPQWSPDGNLIVFNQVSTDPNTQVPRRWHVATINPDGSDLKLLYPLTEQGGAGAVFPTFSPDGTKIAAEVNQRIDSNTWADGIAIMNADGTDLKQLTGIQTSDTYTDCWDSMPTFTSDGTAIVYVHECWPDTGGVNEQLYSVNVDGSNVKKVYGSELAGLLACQPRSFTKDTIAFSSNHEAPGTDAFDMYVVKLDGTGLTRVTNNTLYDGFSVWWMNWNEYSSSAARAYQRVSPRQLRLDHRQEMLQRRK